MRAKKLLKENTCHTMGYFVRQRFDCRVIFLRANARKSRANKIEAIERLNITLTANGKREFVRCDQVSP